MIKKLNLIMMSNLVTSKIFHKDFIKGIKGEIKQTTADITKTNKDKMLLIDSIFSHVSRLSNRLIPIDINSKDVLIQLFDYKAKPITVNKGLNSTHLDKLLIDKINSIKKLNNRLMILTSSLIELNKCIVPYSKYQKVSLLYNDWSMRHCLNGNPIIFAERMGNIVVTVVKKNFDKSSKLMVDNKKSNDYKQYLIDNGEIPYCKKDHEEAIKNGEEYHGKEWLIYHYEDEYPYIYWNKGDKRNVRNYKFTPFRNNNVFKTIGEAVEYLKETNDFDAFFDKGMGFVKNLSVLKQYIPDYLSKFQVKTNT